MKKLHNFRQFLLCLSGNGIARESIRNISFLSSVYNRSKHSVTNCANKLDLTLDEEKGIAVICMNKPPVNSLSLEYLNEFTRTLKDLESTRSCRGFVLTSKIANVFSAGLDIKELHKPNMRRFSEYWRAVQDMWITLYGSPLLSVAAVTGNAPGAGSILALSCDYRIMLDSKCSIGITGTRLGMISPWWFEETLKRAIGHRETELALSLGKLYSPPEALKKGLVDDIASSPDEAIQKAFVFLQEGIRVPDGARRKTKKMLRNSIVEKLLAGRESDIARYISLTTESSTQNAIDDYLKALKVKGR